MLHRWKWLGRSAGLGIVLTTLMVVQPARAADDQADHSLKLIPADAAFYSASLRNREQFEIIGKSKAWAKLQELPALKLFWEKAHEDLTKPGGPLEQFRAITKDPENQQLVELLQDMASEEFFLYGGSGMNDLLDLITKVNGANRFGPALAQLTGQGGGADPSELQAIVLLKALADNETLIKAPDLVLGFRLAKPERAEAQIKRLEKLARMAAEQEPQLKGRVKFVKVDGKDFLTLTLDGKLIPWDDVTLDRYQDKGVDVDKLKKRLRETTLTLALGMKGPYLVLSVGPTVEHVARLGKGGKMLADLPEMKPLAKFADQRLIEISYASKSLREKASTTRKDLDEYVKQGREALKQAGLPEDLKKRLDKDIQELAKDFRHYFPEVGAAVSFSYLTPTGQEGYSYDYSEHNNMDGTKPLSLLDHLGGSPLLAVVGRSKYQPETYQRMVKWMKTIHGYAEEFALPQLPDEQKQAYEQGAKIVFPLLKRLDEATGKMLLPALADGQAALVVDAQWMSKHWYQGGPATDKAMPLPELALVCGVSDPALLKKGLEEYRSVINDALALASNASGGQFPDLKIPAPETRKLKGGTMYYYPIPELLGLDKQVLPNGGLSDRVGVMSLSESHTERLLSKRPLKAEGLLATYREKPLVSAVYFDWAGTVESATPWIEMGVRQVAAEQMPNAEPKAIEDMVKQARDVLDILKVFRHSAAVMYLEGKVLVTRSETVLRDLK